jgi:hypothetical protein
MLSLSDTYFYMQAKLRHSNRASLRLGLTPFDWRYLADIVPERLNGGAIAWRCSTTSNRSNNSRVRLGLNVENGLAGPPGSSMVDMASVTADMPASDAALRQLIISGVNHDGKRIALAARSLFGLGPGSQRLEIPLAAHDGLSPLQAWLSAGDLADEPLTGAWATEDGSRQALALRR